MHEQGNDEFITDITTGPAPVEVASIAEFLQAQEALASSVAASIELSAATRSAPQALVTNIGTSGRTTRASIMNCTVSGSPPSSINTASKQLVVRCLSALSNDAASTTSYLFISTNWALPSAQQSVFRYRIL